jgi:magnesium chelatase subunit I
MAAIQTLGELRRSDYRSRPVKQEIRDNLVRKLQATAVPRDHRHDETVIPQLVNAILSRTTSSCSACAPAKSRILRGQ